MITSKPVVSIGLPVYNGEPLIERAVRSLLDQDYANIELIISNNASTDGTWVICSRLAESDPRIRLSSTDRNIGALGNFARVLNEANGEFFMWASCDDYWSPGFVRRLVQELQADSEAQVGMCAIQRVKEDLTPYDYIRYGGNQFPNPNQIAPLEAFKLNECGVPFYFYVYGVYRRSFLKRAFAGFRSVPGGDHLFISQVLLATRLRYVDEVLYVRTVHEQHVTVRYPTEQFSRMERSGRWNERRRVAMASQVICRSRVIPCYRKIAAVVWLNATYLDARLFPAFRPAHWLYKKALRPLKAAVQP